MSAPKSLCVCRMPKSECVCDDGDVLDLPPDCGPLITSMMGAAPDSGDGPPHENVLRLPETEEEMAAAQTAPTIVVRARKRGTCRHCRTPVTHGPRGWRDDEDGPLAYGCGSAPLGFHEP